MTAPEKLDSIDYLVLGHLSCDLVSNGDRLGGTAAYSSLTAKALGLKPGIVTAWTGDLPVELQDGIQIHTVATSKNTTFENVYTPEGRIQILHNQANRLKFEDIPESWRRCPILHIGPIAQEVDTDPGEFFSGSLLGLTPQGWMRKWNEQGRVSTCSWMDAASALPKAGAVVISVEDVGGDEEEIERMAIGCRVLAVTEGPAGARCYWNNDQRRFRAPKKQEVDATGAGDIFATAFFYRLYSTRDPWEAARFATQLASYSVTRTGLAGIPNQEEIISCLTEVI